MADKILYTDKEVLIDDESIPLKNKVTADDMNEIKEVVNSHADDIETLDEEKADRTEIPTDLSELSNENTKFVNETQLANAVDDEKTARQDADSAIVNTIATISVDYGKTIELSLDSSTFILTATLKNKNGATLNQSSIDLPIESMIVNGRYDSASKKIILILQNGNTIEIPVGDLISGLQSEITPQNKLSSDLVDDTNHTNKFVTQAEKNQIETNKNNIINLNENKENISNKVTELTEESTDIQYPSAKAVYDNESALKEKLDRYKNTIETELGDSTATGTDLTLNGTAEFDVGLQLSGNTEQATSVLPSEYTQVDYIKSSGTQYIDTGFIPNQDTSIEIKFKKGDATMLFGSRESLNSKAFALTMFNAYVRSDYGTQNININQDFSNIILLKREKNKIYINNEYINEHTVQTFTCPGNLYLFGLNNNGTVSYGTHFIYSCKILNNDALVRNFIPCYRNNDNEVGLYDLVNDVFYTNAGTGAFTYGSVVTIPNPEYPQNVQVVKGNNKINIQTKNKLEDTNWTLGKYLDSNNEIQTLGSWCFSDYIPIDKSFIYISYNAGSAPKNILYDSQKNMIGYFDIKGSSSVPNTTLLSNYPNAKYVRVSLTQSSISKNKLYKEQTYPITLPEGMEMCKIGNYADEFIFQNSKWYKNKKINKNVLNGTETWTADASGILFGASITGYTSGGMVANYYTWVDTLSVARTNSAYFSFYSGKIYLNGQGMSLSEFTSWLSTHNVIFYYPLNTPVPEEITDTTLITQLNNIKEAYTYKGQTNISQTNEDLPFIITADFKLSNLSRIEALEQANS